MDFLQELKSRNVFKVGISYLVIGWVLIQIADTAFPAFGAPEWVLRIFMLCVALGFPVALVMAWALELTPKGVRKAGGRNSPIYVLAVVLAAATVYWFGAGHRPAPEPHTPQVTVKPADSAARAAVNTPAIAILPFENMSGDDINAPFTAGVHDDLLTQVSKIASLKTISRTSVLQYRGSDKTIPEIARELGVTSVLEGGVQRVGDSVRVNVQLIDAATDEHLWAETFDRELSAASIFAIQSEIATAVAGALKATLTAADQERLSSAPTRDLSALEAYFLGKQLADVRSEANLRQAIGYFDLAISLDQDFALAHAGRSYAWLLIPEYDAGQDRSESKRISRAAAERSLQLDPDLPEGLVMSAWIQLREYHWEAAEALLRQAIEIHPASVDAMHWLSHVQSWQGRHDEALATAQKAVNVDPLSPLMLMNLSYIQMDARLYEDSIRTRDRTLRIKNDMHEQMRNMWLTFLRAGRDDEATGALLVWAEGTGRDLDAARELGQLLARRKTSHAMIELPAVILEKLELGTENLGQVYAAAGDAENTLRELEIALEEKAGSRSVLSMKINPLYDFLRDDPRFIMLMKQANLGP